MSFKKIVFIVSFVAVLCFAFNFNAPQANAFTADEIRAQIVALMAQISQLQKQLIEVQGGQAVWCHTFDRDLKYGNAGTEVRALQTALTKDGATAWEYKGYDGVFDEMTASSVVGFQQKYKQDILVPWGLEYGTGFVGKTTREKLNELYGCGTTPVQKCTDTDGGDGYYTKGTVKVNGIEMIDVCKDGNTVIEFYCAWDGSNYRQTEHICPNGCVDGACVRETTPSITVTSPNGGEQWVAGNTYDIKWTSTGIDADLPVEITLIDDVQNKEYQIESYLAKIGDGKLTWTHIPAHTFYTDSSSLFTGNKFKIRVYVATKDVTSRYPDESNDYFSIVAQEPATCHTSDLWAWNYCSPSCKCDAGQGDCDTDADCADGLYCAKNVGTQYGQISTMDVCEEKATGSLSVSLTTDTPPSGTTYKKGVKQAEFLKLKLSASPEEDIIVKGIKIGVVKHKEKNWYTFYNIESGDLSNMKLFTPQGTLFGSIINPPTQDSVMCEGGLQVMNFQDNFRIKAGTSQALTLRGDILSTTNAVAFRTGFCTSHPDVGVGTFFSTEGSVSGSAITIETNLPNIETEKTNLIYVREEEPSITVISPNGGEQWVTGKTRDITWESVGVDKVVIAFCVNLSTGISCYNIAETSGGINAELKKHSWWLDPSNRYFQAFDKFKIKIRDASDYSASSIHDLSDDYFSIVAAQPETCHTSDLWAWDYCSPSCKCNAGEGDCDTDADCADGLYCAKNVGTQYGQDAKMDVCEVKQTVCSSTDGDYKDIYTKGTTTYGTENKTDYCINSIRLKEYYCDHATGISWLNELEYDCPNGCVDGACVKSITVTSPNGGEEWVIGNTYDIKWDSIGGVDKVNVEIMGASLRKTIASLDNNPGFYNYTVPDTFLPGKYSIRVHSYDLHTGDDSDSNFSIVEAITCADSDGGKDYYTKGVVAGKSTAGSGNFTGNDHCNFDGKQINSCSGNGCTLVEYYCSDEIYVDRKFYRCPNGCVDGACVKGYEPYCSAIGSRSQGWYVDTGVDRLELIRWDNNCDGCYAVCKAIGSKSEGWYSSCDNELIKYDNCGEQLASITVLSPNGGEEWVIGDTREIKWSSTGIDKVDIGYRKEGSGADFITIDSGISALSGKYSWTVGRVLSVENQQGSFCIVISESPYIAGSVQHEDKSDDYFSIVVATIELKDLGTNCSVASECKSGFCADSVCCENACNTAHYRCDSRGKCTAPTDLTQTDCFNWGSNSCVGYCPTWCAGESMCKECWGSSMRVYSNNSCSGTGDAVYSGSCNQLGGSCKCFYNRYLYE